MVVPGPDPFGPLVKLLFEQGVAQSLQHKRISFKKLLNLVQIHVLRISFRLEGPTDKVVGRLQLHDADELGKISRLELVVLDESACNFCILGVADPFDGSLAQVRIGLETLFGK